MAIAFFAGGAWAFCSPIGFILVPIILGVCGISLFLGVYFDDNSQSQSSTPKTPKLKKSVNKPLAPSTVASPISAISTPAASSPHQPQPSSSTLLSPKPSEADSLLSQFVDSGDDIVGVLQMLEDEDAESQNLKNGQIHLNDSDESSQESLSLQRNLKSKDKGNDSYDDASRNLASTPFGSYTSSFAEGKRTNINDRTALMRAADTHNHAIKNNFDGQYLSSCSMLPGVGHHGKNTYTYDDGSSLESGETLTSELEISQTIEHVDSHPSTIVDSYASSPLSPMSSSVSTQMYDEVLYKNQYHVLSDAVDILNPAINKRNRAIKPIRNNSPSLEKVTTFHIDGLTQKVISWLNEYVNSWSTKLRVLTERQERSLATAIKALQDEGGFPGYVKMCKEASKRADMSMLRVLYRANDDIKYSDGEMTALMYAAQLGYRACVEFLANKESGKKDESGMTALMHAVQKGQTECVLLLRDILEERGHEKTALRYAVESWRYACLEVLLENNSWSDEDINTALTYAEKHGKRTALKSCKNMYRKRIMMMT